MDIRQMFNNYPINLRINIFKWNECESLKDYSCEQI